MYRDGSGIGSTLIGITLTVMIVAFIIFGGREVYRSFDEHMTVAAESMVADENALNAQMESDEYIYAITGKHIETHGVIGKDTYYMLDYTVTYTCDGEARVFEGSARVSSEVFEEARVGDYVDLNNLCLVDNTEEI